MFKMINTWIKRAIQKIKGKPKDEYDIYSAPNGPTFYVPKGTTPPGVNDNVWIKPPEEEPPIKINGTPVRPIPVRPNPPPKPEVKADTDGDDTVYSVDNMLMPLGLDEDELKLTKEEIKEVDNKIDNWYDKKSANETLKDVAHKINKDKCHDELIKCVDEFKEKQKNLKRDKDISPIYDNTLPDADIPDDIVFNIVKGNNFKPKEEKRTKPRRRRRSNKKKSGEKK